MMVSHAEVWDLLHWGRWLPSKQIYLDLDPYFGSEGCKSFLSGLLIGMVSVSSYHIVSKYVNSKSNHKKKLLNTMNKRGINEGHNHGDGIHNELEKEDFEYLKKFSGRTEMIVLGCCSQDNTRNDHESNDSDDNRQSSIGCNEKDDNSKTYIEIDKQCSPLKCNCCKTVSTVDRCYVCLPKLNPVFVLKVKTADASTQCDVNFDANAVSPVNDKSPAVFDDQSVTYDNDVNTKTKAKSVLLPKDPSQLLCVNQTGSRTFDYSGYSTNSLVTHDVAETDSIRRLDGAITEVNSMLRKLGSMLEQTRVEFSSRRASIVSNQEYLMGKCFGMETERNEDKSGDNAK